MSLTAAAYDAVIPAITIWREARGEPFTGKVAVAHVLRNRASDPRRRWRNTTGAVCTQRWQFSCWNPQDPNALKWPKANSTAWLDSCAAWESSLGMPDPTGGANHYHSIRDPTKYPSWAKARKRTTKIGAFTFYRL